VEVAVLHGLLPGLHRDVRPGLDAPDRAVQRLGLRDVLQDQVVLQCGRVQLVRPGDAELGGQLQEALLLARERDAGRSGREEQRFDAERVPRHEQLALPGVPDREGEHPAQPRDGLGAPVVVGRDDRLGVALGRELRAQLGELLAQLEVVVDLAVEDDRVPPGLLVRRGRPVQRLVGARHVDDRQAVEAQHHVVVVPGAALVRPPVPRAPQGAGDGLGPVGRVSAGGQQSQQSAHSEQVWRSRTGDPRTGHAVPARPPGARRGDLLG
jgi:hypothetical protein